MALAMRPGNEMGVRRQSPIAWLPAASGLSFSKKSKESSMNAMTATTIDPAIPIKNNVSRKSTRKCSMIASNYFNGSRQAH
jgi:hypothetical protein